MEEFSIIYRFLKALRGMMDKDEINLEAIGPEAMRTTRGKLDALCIMMQKNGLIEGLRLTQFDGMNKPVIMWDSSCPQVTLKGLEYLEENSLMQKAKRAASGVLGVAGIVPKG